MQSTNGERSRSTQSQSNLVGEALAAHMRDVESLQQLHRLAERHGRLTRDSLLARELVADVIEDMFMGEMKCDPERMLAPQIERHVLRRANRLRKANRPSRRRRGAPRLELIPLDEVPRSALAAEPPQDSPDAPGAAEVVSRIRELASDDDAAQRLLAFYGRDVVLRRDVLAAGMTEWGYRAARDRLAGYAALATSSASMAEPVTERPASTDVEPAMLVSGPPGQTERAPSSARAFDRALD